MRSGDALTGLASPRGRIRPLSLPLAPRRDPHTASRARLPLLTTFETDTREHTAAGRQAA